MRILVIEDEQKLGKALSRGPRKPSSTGSRLRITGEEGFYSKLRPKRSIWSSSMSCFREEMDLKSSRPCGGRDVRAPFFS